jgi:hypothetical protein
LGYGADGTERSVTASGKLGSLMCYQARSAEEMGGVGAHRSGAHPPWYISYKGRNIPEKISQICMKANIDQSVLLLLLLKGK